MNLFASLVDRALGHAPVLQRRRPTLFEPAGNAVLTTRDNPTDLLREEQSYTEAESPVARTDKIVNTDQEDSRAKSQPARSNAAATVTPRATDITLVEEQPAFKPADRETGDSDNDRRNLPIREQTLTQDAPQQLSQSPKTTSLAPSLETIVETKPERQTGLQRPGEENPFDEVDLVADAPEDVQSSIVNNIVVLRAIAQKQNSGQIDESRLLKPVTQRRPTRQQMQRSPRARLQSEHQQMDAPTLPTINVTIGRVEVRASAAAKRADAARPTAPKLSLEEYLRGRSRGN